MLLRLLPFFACLIYGCLIAWGAQANTFQKGDWMVRARAVAILPDTSGTITPIGGTPYISTAVIPEIDLNYYLTDNISVEGIIGIIPHKAKARNTSLGDRDAGWIYTFAPTVILQYNKQITEHIKPYLGAGIAYIKYFEDDTIDQIQYKDDFGAVMQAGVDIKISEKWYANLDIKHVWADTVAKLNNGAARADVEFNPTIYSAGFGYKF